MRVSPIVSLLVIFSFFCSSAFPQLPIEKADPEKEKAALELEKNALELLDQAAAEAFTLKLPENRALIFAMAGDVVWSKDAKRGRELFRYAGNNIIQFVNSPEDKTRPVNSMSGRSDIYYLRRMVLTSIAVHDAELALEFLLATRSPDVTAELQAYLSQNAPTSDSAQTPRPRNISFNYKVNDEIRLEQAIAARGAEQDPRKAVKMMQESLAKGISDEVMTLIYKVTEKDAELGNKLLSDVFQKVFETDLLKNGNEFRFAYRLLRTFSQPQMENPIVSKTRSKIKVEDKTLRDLANKLADSLMKITDFRDASAFNAILPTIEKFVPERIALLKQKQAAFKKQTPDKERSFEFPPSFYDPNASAETLITDAVKAGPQIHGVIYREAANRAFRNNNDPEKVRALLQNLPESKERDDAIAFIDARLSAKQLEAGKLDEARKLIDRMPAGNEKVEQIVRMAISSHKLNTKESKDKALFLMEEAKQMVKDFPEDKDEMDGLLKVIAGYAVIDAPRAFSMLSPVIEQTNDLINANAMLAKFNKQNHVFRDGEIVMLSSFNTVGYKFFRYGKEMKMLAQTDLGKTRGLIDQFRREDVRVFAKVFIAQGILKQEIGL